MYTFNKKFGHSLNVWMKRIHGWGFISALPVKLDMRAIFRIQKKEASWRNYDARMNKLWKGFV
nr:hypothetical protein XYFPCFBP8417_02360 [Xylella fastidiosa subsp. multiplex]